MSTPAGCELKGTALGCALGCARGWASFFPPPGAAAASSRAEPGGWAVLAEIGCGGWAAAAQQGQDQPWESFSVGGGEEAQHAAIAGVPVGAQGWKAESLPAALELSCRPSPSRRAKLTPASGP